MPAVDSEEANRKAGKVNLLRSVAVLAGGTALSQLVYAVAFPLITRIYEPAQIGMLGVFTSVVSTLAIVASVGYQLAIPIPGSTRVAVNLLGISVSTAVAAGVVLSVAVGVGGAAYARWANAPGLASFLWLAPITLTVMGVYQALTYWATRKHAYSAISLTRSAQSVTQAAVQVGAGIAGLGVGGLVVGFAISQFVGIAALLRRAPPPLQQVAFSAWRRVARQYKEFPLFTAPASLVNVIGVQMPVVLFSAWFSAASAGHFMLTMRILGLPLALVGRACAQVFFPTIARCGSDGDRARELVERTAVFLSYASVTVFAILITQAPNLFIIAFGTEWSEAGRYAQLLSFWFMCSLVSSALSGTALVKKRQRTALWITTYETTARLLAIAFGAVFGSPVLAVGMFAVAGVVICLIYIGWTLRIVGSSWGHLLRRLRPLGASSGVLLTCLLLLTLPKSPTVAVAGSVVCVFVFGVWALRTGKYALTVGT